MKLGDNGEAFFVEETEEEYVSPGAGVGQVWLTLMAGHCWLGELSLWVEELGCHKGAGAGGTPPAPSPEVRLPMCEGPGVAPTVSVWGLSQVVPT